MLSSLGSHKSDFDTHQLLSSTSRNLIITTFALYIAWHMMATLTWPRIFSPSLWLSTLMMLAIVFISLRLVDGHLWIAQIAWLAGLTLVILQAYTTYKRPEIALLFAILPLMAIVTTGLRGTLLLELFILAAVLTFGKLSFLPALPSGYPIGILFASICTGSIGWGLSTNLLAAIDSSSYHYEQARTLLEETRQHRAEISRMLKEQTQANYQLERLNQMLHSARIRAEEARDDRDRFILAVSHELRSPLNFILGFSDLMVNSPATYAPRESWPPGLYDDIQEVYRSSTHLLGLINDILDMGQIDAQQMTLFREKVSLEHVVQEVTKMAGSAFAQKGLWLRAEFAPDLPQVFIDTTRIRQVLLNLVTNSLRFTETGGVTIHASATDEHLLITVEDTGSGIAPEDVPKVFDEFRQVGQASWRRREGTGLGLSISRRFIELHGGRIWLESEPGRGTRFYFTIPIHETAAPLAETETYLQPAHPLYQIRQEQLVLLLSEEDSLETLLQQDPHRLPVQARR